VCVCVCVCVRCAGAHCRMMSVCPSALPSISWRQIGLFQGCVYLCARRETHMLNALTFKQARPNLFTFAAAASLTWAPFFLHVAPPNRFPAPLQFLAQSYQHPIIAIRTHSANRHRPSKKQARLLDGGLALHAHAATVHWCNTWSASQGCARAWWRALLPTT